MVILRTRNKITDFLMILAWASPFKHTNRGDCRSLIACKTNARINAKLLFKPICLTSLVIRLVLKKKKNLTQVKKHTMYQSSRRSSAVKSQFKFNKK